MKAVSQFILLLLLIASSLAENNSLDLQAGCGASLGEDTKAFPIDLYSNENCTWKIQRPENKVIRLIFSYFQLDPSASCEMENIKVYDGPTSNSPLLGQVCSNIDSVPVFESSSNSLSFQVTTDSTDLKRSIFAFYYFFPPGSKTEDCGGLLTSPEGTLTSPNYPKPHPEFTYCVWRIQTAENSKINLTFTDLFLELDPNCRFDFLAIYDGPSTKSDLIGHVCGRSRPTFESTSNTMTLALSTDYANSYRGFSAHYTSIALPTPKPKTSLTCSSDIMTVVLSDIYLDSLSYNENNLQLNDPTCRPISRNPVIFSFPLNSCGTVKMKEGNRITYTNLIAASQTGEIITRQKNLQIFVKCEMENNSTVEIMYVSEDGVIQNSSALGRYNVSMSFYESDLFTRPILDSPYYIDLNKTLFVQVSLHSTDADLLVFVDTCVASPNLDFGSPTYTLIQNGCIKDDTYMNYPLLQHYGRFKFNAFEFLRNHASVYLQCQVLICDSNESNSRCTQGCVPRQKRDISSYKWKANAVIGPIRLKRDRSSVDHLESLSEVHPGKTQNLQQNSLYIFSFMILATNVVILAVVIVKHYIKCQSEYKYQKLQGY
ncbi:CUB and zona pellucida-like domain-containing protein 1 [Alligator sinensis]|uniref:CUB and zona pellucida-like domain-containing protein 1 n=1 Tax=Alligator sinensis TaxID=38654 RepID=A0A3Q0GQN0_ALLSI|nr:CUB and zona pellucida-like domain-containing protein 1 [Alligator sinensis]